MRAKGLELGFALELGWKVKDGVRVIVRFWRFKTSVRVIKLELGLEGWR